ncbi:hypothetical protein KKF61_06915 [Patescibacteria group bacterium]|nr:hypothetical protein [Patescibacteria group bacterium]
MKKEKKCPRKNCKNDATIDKVYGILPCEECQVRDSEIRITKSPESYSLAKSHRIQKARDVHAKDVVQPFMSNKPNPDYFKIHPDQIDKHGVREELKKA